MFPSKTAVISGGASTGDVFSNTFSLLLDGTDDRVDIGDESIYEFTYDDSYTISAWVYLTTLVGGSMVMSKAQTSGQYTGWYVYINGTTGLVDKALYSTSSSYRWKLRATDNAITINNWHHIILTHTYSSGHVGNIVIDGVKQTTSVQTGTLGTQDTRATSVDMSLGMRNTTNAGLTGYIDECAVWDVALDTPACIAVYNSGAPFDLRNDNGNYDEYTDDLIGYWRLEEGTGLTATDLGSGSNDGVVTGGAAWEKVTP